LTRSVVLRSELIATAEEAQDYYALLVGDHEINVRGQVVTIRFASEEIHPFTEKLRAGSTPRAEFLVRRPGKSGEVRVFSRCRARRLDDIIPTLENPSGCVAAKKPGALMVFGPSDTTGSRMAVIIAPDGGACFVRTAYTLTAKEYRDLLRSGTSRRLPWPPK
jgi:hypothetical protein